jgi:CHAT domain-containing protein/tetratricopeptide (TPR) repeat protein
VLSRKLVVFAFLLVVAASSRGAAPAEGPPSAAQADLLAAAGKEAAAGHTDSAIKSYAAARQAAAQAHDEKSEAVALLGMATTEYAKGSYDACAKYAAESLALAEKLGELAAQADALKLIGNVQYEKGDRAGMQTAERVLAIRRKLGDRAGTAVALNNLATAYRYTDPLKAIGYFEQSQREFQILADGRRATVLNNIAEAYQRLGDFTRAIDYCRRALALAESNRDSGPIAVGSNLLGVIEMDRGNFSEALASYERALVLHKASGFLWGEAEVLNNVGLLYQFQGNHPQAIAYLLQAIELNRKLGDQSLEAESRNNLAEEYLEVGRPTDAEQDFRRSLALSRTGAYWSLAADSLTGLARIHARAGQRAVAAREIDEALALARSVPDRRSIADSLVQLAFLRLDAGRAGDALAVSTEAQQAASAAEDSDALWQAQLAAGKALRRLKRPAEAAAAFDASIATIEGQRARIAGPAEAQPLYFADKLEPFREGVALRVEAGKIDDALRIVERSKSRVLYDVLRSGHPALDRALPAPDRDRERNLQNELVSLNIGIAKQPDDAEARTRRDEKRRELQALQTTLFAEHPELAFQRGAEAALPVEAMSRLAAETRAVLLDFFVTRERTYLFVVSPGSGARVVAIPVREAELTRDILEFRRRLASHDLAYAGAARRLYRQLLAPAARDLAGATAVVVVPDGPLWSIPFGALQNEAGRFWIEDVAISYAPSLGILQETRRIERIRQANPAPRQLLALGNPKTIAAALPEAERQVRVIGALYGAGESEVLVGADASEHRFIAEAGGFQVLHLASHAVLDDGNPMFSHVLLAAGDGDDGLLEARKLMELDLKAEMLVLSGCETARGDAPAGEGITGMLWASFVAGVPTTIASLWRVESASTSELMIEFHREWLASRGKDGRGTKAQALRAAARKLIASGKYSHPFYWAGFILAGSP